MCGAERKLNKGFCGADEKITVARTVRHFWEEPCISGKKGSGAIFFSGCSLKCIYCQNHTISNGGIGKKLSKKEFQSLVLNTANSGVDNINLVTPTHYTEAIAEALSEIKSEIEIPVVWNSSGYELDSSIKELRGLVDIFLCDVKYFSKELSREYSHAPDYFDVAIKALSEMIKISPTPVFDENGMMRSGVIVRHLVLPGGKKDSENVLSALSRFKDNILLSLMCQYTPTPNVSSHPKLSRRTTSLEYSNAVKLANAIGFDGYTQEKSSAKSEYTPDFKDTWDFTC